MISPMDRVEIVFLRSELQDMITFLQSQGVIHVETVPLAMENHPGFLHRTHLPAEEKAELEDLLQFQTTLKEAIPLLSQGPGHVKLVEAGQRLEREGLSAWRTNIQEYHRTLRALSRRKLNAQDSLELLRNYKRILQNIAPVMRERNMKLGENVRILVLQAQTPEAIQDLEKKMVAEIGPETQLVQQPISRNETVVIVQHPASKAEAVSAFLKREEIATVDVQENDLQAASADTVISKIEAKEHGYVEDIEKITQETVDFSQEHGGELVAADQMIANRIAQLNVIEHFAQSKMVGVVQGWVPAEAMKSLEAAVQSKFGTRAVVGHLSHDEIDHHHVPTKLKNPPFFKPFELILKIFAPPTYGTIDPTIMVAIAFILFYGFIMGDVGYGLFIIGVATWAKKKWSHVEMIRDAMTIATYMGISSIVFGIPFGEFFGDLPTRILGFDPPLHRMHSPMVLLGIAFAVGAIHVPLALMLGVREGYKHGHKHHAEEKLGMLINLAGLAFALLGLAGILPGMVSAVIAVVLFAVGTFYLIKSMGGMFAIGVIELIGISANILSYGRLMALGLASVALADLANRLLEAPGPWLLVGIIGAGLVHLLNIGIGVFSPTIHSLRLNYVEFLPKFYEPEGRSYEPFRKDLAW